MRVLFFNYEYPPLGGGAANATQYIMSEYGHLKNITVDVITSSIDEKFHEEKISENVTIYKLPIGKKTNSIHFQSNKDLLVYSWQAYFFSKKLLHKKIYDLTHSFFTIPCGYLSYLFYISHKLPYIISLRGSDVPGYNKRFNILYFFLTPLIHKIWKNATAVIANSGGLKDLANTSLPEQEIGIIYNGVDVDQFRVRESYENDCYKSQHTLLKILCVSRLIQRKGINYLLDALFELKKKGVFVQLDLIGSGDAEVDLKRQVSDYGLDEYVRFRGVITHDCLPDEYKKADIFVLPSLNEGMSNTVLEALAAGLPVVVTSTGGMEELIENCKNGFIVDIANSSQLAEKIGFFVHDRLLCSRMGRESRKKAETMSWRTVAYDYHGLYNKVLYLTKKK